MDSNETPRYPAPAEKTTYGAETPGQQQYQQQNAVMAQPAAPATQQGYPPQAQPSYAAVGTAPVTGPASGMGQVRDWQTGFFDCCDPIDLCCFAVWCPCVLFGKTQQRLRDPSMASYETFNGNCIGWFALCSCCGLQWIIQMMKRGEMRQQYNLDGSGAGDCARAYCCNGCDLIQQEKEAVLLTGTAAGGANAAAAAPAAQQGYQKTETGMQYGQQTA